MPGKTTPSLHTPLKDLDKIGLQELMASWGEKSFHGRQIYAALFKRGIASVEEMTDLPKRLRDRLREYKPLDLVTPVLTRTADDGTVKALLEMKDGKRVETVWMPEEGYASQCLSTQVGCPLDCAFCATGRMGFERNLTAGEIVDQVIFFRRIEKAKGPLPESGGPPRNLVFMGIGEPLLNYAALVQAIRVLSDEGGPAIAQRRMTVSTAGIVPGILRLAQEGLKVKLAVSLNAPIDELRDRIMPINRKYPIAEVMKAAAEYQQKNGFRITFEYALMPGINDTEPMIRALRKWLLTVPAKLNLIPLNPIEKSAHPPADWDAIFDRFYKVFARDSITLTMRRSRGQEIRAACGQLAAQNR
ncbi:MAG: 23S rRNA (adenine(2503)-C(2))-methyltransferase RlmN [Candidatus Zixiibacteriota bacterium]|nr:MAG: 23S rRNA (adenine(2503)-C(2))-methyltransferase RlmN [candidate division Zixibacteria bacterium]